MTTHNNRAQRRDSNLGEITIDQDLNQTSFYHDKSRMLVTTPKDKMATSQAPFDNIDVITGSQIGQTFENRNTIMKYSNDYISNASLYTSQMPHGSISLTRPQQRVIPWRGPQLGKRNKGTRHRHLPTLKSGKEFEIYIRAKRMRCDVVQACNRLRGVESMFMV